MRKCQKCGGQLAETDGSCLNPQCPVRIITGRNTKVCKLCGSEFKPVLGNMGMRYKCWNRNCPNGK